MSDLSINERLQILENELKELKNKKETSDKKDKSTEKKEKSAEKKEKKPRQKTEYNMFMGEFIAEQKEKLGSTFNHKEAFSNGAKAWKERKEQS